MSGTIFAPSRITVRTRLWISAAVFVCLLCGFAGAPSAQTFAIDLNKLTAIYDELFPERTAVAVWDTLAAYDFDNILFGNQRHKVPSFLTTEIVRTRTIDDYMSYPGYRARYMIPITYSLVQQQRKVGELEVPVERNFNIPGIRIEIVSMDRIASEIRVASLREQWIETIAASVVAQKRGEGIRGRQGITINIPVPMPRQLESIFGPSDKTHINISGRESITISGETRVVDPFIGVEGRQSQSLFPSLDMRQELDVRLTGSIGDKVNIQIDHSSQALADNDNRISLNYVGYDDDVVQRIELGNTSLSLPGSQLVSISTQSKGLFGIKMLAKMGATDMTFIASKQEGETSNASFSPAGGSIGQAETRVLRDVDYVRNKYFYFDHPLAFVGATNDSIIDVYRSVEPRDVQANPEINRFPGVAFVDSNGFGTDINEAMANIIAGRAPRKANVRKDFQLLEQGIDYSFVVDIDNFVVGIELSQPLTDANKALAVRYTNEPDLPADRVNIGGKYTEFGVPIDFFANEKDTLVLELLWAGSSLERPDNQYGWTWGYMMRHIYNLGLSNIDPTTFTLEIEDRLDPRLDATFPVDSDVPYIRIFGLDRFDQSGLEVPDGRVDLNTGVMDINRGTLSFLAPIATVGSIGQANQAVLLIPLLDPDSLATPQFTGFAPDTNFVRAWTDSFQFDGQYDAQWQKSRRIYREWLNDIDELDVNQYLIKVTAVSTSKTFQLDAFNIIENSEAVTLDGQRLSRGSDYDINYETGEVTLKGGTLDRLTADSKINVDYEFKPLGGGLSSNLVGFNAISRQGNIVLGTTWLYESKAAEKVRPRIGEEPSRAIVGGVNGSFQHESNLLTSMANILPLVDSDAPSSVTINGELAVSFPDPNTRGEATIDDLEGSEDSDRITLSRRRWYWASPPLIPTSNDQGREVDPADRSDFVWYNIEPALAVTRQDLNPTIKDIENTTIQSLDIDLNAAPVPGDTTSWVGVMGGFGGGGLDLTNGQFLEIWVNDFTQDPLKRQGTLRIDLGTIDEDFFEPEKNEFNDEDKDRDGFAAAFDDTGLDGLFNVDEPGNTTDDPNLDLSGDDLDLSRVQGRFTKVNGTEANRAYDSEDIDGNTQLDEINAFFSYEIDLSSVADVDISQEFPNYKGFEDPGHQHDAWRKYRVRLSNAKVVAPDGVEPRFDQVRHIRIWFKDLDQILPDSLVAEDIGNRIQITEFKIQGNRWILDGVRDFADNPADTLAMGTDLTLGAISNKSDPGVYFPPIRPREDANGVQDKESSLAMVYDSLAAGFQVRIRKQFAGNGIDLSQYRDLHFWLNTDSLRTDVEYFYRMGTNENNYYEVGLPLTADFFAGPRSWHRVSLLLADVTNLKFEVADSNGVVTGTAIDIVDPAFEYPVRMKGNPSLFNIRFLYAGVRNLNPDSLSRPIDGSVWINDIYVGDVRRDVDFAQRLGISVSIAGGTISLGGSWNRTGPDFRSLRQRRGSNSEIESVGFNGTTNIRHFLPLAGFSVPITVTYGRNTSKPKFVPNSDTEIIDEADADSLKTTSISQSFATSVSKRGSKNFLFKYTIDKMTTNFSVSQSKSAGPASRDTTTSMNGTLGYNITWSGQKSIRLFPFKTRFRWWLNSLTFRTNASRRETHRWRNLGGEFKPDPELFSALLVNTGSANYQPFPSLSSTFNMTVNRDVGLPHQWYGVNVGTEVRRNQQLRVGWKPRLPFIDIFAPDLDVTSSYNENSSPNVRRQDDPVGTRNTDVSRTGSLKMRFDLGKYIETLFDAVGWDVRGEEEEPVRGGGAARPSTPPPVGSPVDSTAVAGEDSTEASKADPTIALRGFGRILTDIRRIEVSLSQRMSNSYTRIPDRPSLEYQLGVTADTGIEGFDEPEGLTNSLGMNLRSGVTLTKSLDIQVIYTRNLSDSDFRNSKTRAVSTTWPDVQVSWEGLERFALFRPYFAAARANLNFKIFKQESGRQGEDPDNVRDDFSLVPSMSFTFKNEVNTNLSVSYNKNTSDTRGSVSENNSLSVSLDFRKVFRGGAGFRIPIPFMSKRVEWSSQLDTNLSMAYTRTGGKRFTEGSAFFEPVPSTTSLRVSPSVSYSFTDALSGRMFVDYNRRYNESTDQTITTLRLGVNAVFTF